MRRRREPEEIVFGSDSFLDIVANVVGILIILIVIAGVRVSNMPAVSPDSDVVSTVTEAGDDDRESAGTPPAAMIAVAAPARLPSPPPPPEPVKPLQPDPELLNRLATVRRDIGRLKQTGLELSSRLPGRKEAAVALHQQVESLRVAVTEDEQRVENGRRTIGQVQASLESAQRGIAGLHLEMAEAEAAQPAPQELRHNLTPIGRKVSGDELHFLLSGNRVAVVPVEELVEELKSELLRKKSQFLRGQIRVGTVGPVKGFSMEYVVEREALSLVEELRVGTAVIRLGVSAWRLLPQRDLVYESAEEALLPRSRFLKALRSAGASATLTYWVYPDSFGLHKTLQEFAHDNGFDVAGRPLPHGMPITGSSTRGTRSIAQ